MSKPNKYMITSLFSTKGNYFVSYSSAKVLLLLLSINALNQLDRYILASFAPQITEDLSLTNSMFGLLSSTLVIIPLAIFTLLSGVLADRVDRYRLISAGLALWSLMTLWTGLARSYMEVAFARLLLGVGESVVTPSATTLIGDTVQQQRQGTGAGIFFLGIPLGIGLSYVLAGTVGPELGWRIVLVSLGLIGLFMAACLPFIRDRARGAAVDQRSINTRRPIREAVRESFVALRERPQLRYFIAAIVCLHSFYAGLPFTQLWMVRELELDGPRVALVYGAVSVVAGISGALVCGSLSDWYNARYADGRAGFLLKLTLVSVPLMLLFRFAEPGSLLFYLGMSVGFFFVMGIYGPAFATLQELSPVAARSSLIGVTVFLVNILPLALGAMLVGVTSDLLSRAGVTASLTLVLICTDVMMLIALPCLYPVVRNFQAR